MKNQALIEILFILLSRDKTTAKYLSERLDCSLRTVYRYIDELSLVVPIYNTLGRNGGFSISDTYKLPSAFFTKEESEFLKNLLNGISSEVNSPILIKIIDKITAVSKKNSDSSHIDFGNLILDGGPWGNTESYKQTLAFLEKCIEEKTILSIGYRDREGVLTEREIEPHTIILKQGLWYCYAYCLMRNEFRLFKIGRIEKTKATNKTFERRSTENLKESLQEWYNSFNCETVDLEIDKSIKADVEEWIGVDKVYVSSNGVIKASANLPIDEVLASKILSFGKKVKVISPISLKKQIIIMAKEITENYA